MKMDNQKNANIMIKATVLSAIILFLLCFIVIFCIAFSRDETSEIQENGERYGASDFYKYKDKIYALVIGNGMLEVEGVDIPTFKVFDTEYNSRNVAYDKNKIYFGNIAVSDLDTDKLYYVGNNYYSDGTNSYFCSTSVETYEELSALSINIKNISHHLSLVNFIVGFIWRYFYDLRRTDLSANAASDAALLDERQISLHDYSALSDRAQARAKIADRAYFGLYAILYRLLPVVINFPIQ